MARVCQVTGKKTTSGNNRPFSLKATKRTFRPNLFWKKMWNPETGRVERMRLSANAIKTLKKLAVKAGFKTTAEKAVEKAKLSAGQNAKHTTNEEKGRVHKTKLTPKQKKELAAQEEAAKMEKAATFDTEKKETE